MKNSYNCMCGLRFYPTKRQVYDGKRFGLIKAKYVQCPTCRKKVWLTTLWGKEKFKD